MYKYLSTLGLLCICIMPYVYGQQVLTLDKARQLAIESNEELKIASMQKEKALSQQAIARTHRLPAFSASGTTAIYQSENLEMELILPTKAPNLVTGELEPNILIHPETGQPVVGPDGNPLFNMYAWLPLEVNMQGAYLLGVTATQPLFAGGRINAGNRMANIGVSMASENIRLQRMNVIAEADNAYWTFVSVTQKVVLAELAVEMLTEFVRLAENSYQVGMVSRNDVLKAQVEHNNAILDLKTARNGHELSRINLCRIVGLPFDTQIMTEDTIIEINQPVTDALFAFELNQRPEYRLLEKNIELSEQNIRLARAEFLPEAGVQLGYNHIGGIEIGPDNFSNTSFNVMGSIRIPIFQWGQGANKISSARIDMEMRKVELERNRKLMQLEVEQSRLNMLLARERIEMNKFALDQAAENLRMIRDSYQLGRETMTDLILAQTQWQQAYSELIDANANFRLTETAWLKATGRLGE